MGDIVFIRGLFLSTVRRVPGLRQRCTHVVTTLYPRLVPFGVTDKIH